jgi:hypothetical protein
MQQKAGAFPSSPQQTNSRHVANAAHTAAARFRPRAKKKQSE